MIFIYYATHMFSSIHFWISFSLTLTRRAIFLTSIPSSAIERELSLLLLPRHCPFLVVNLFHFLMAHKRWPLFSSFNSCTLFPMGLFTYLQFRSNQQVYFSKFIFLLSPVHIFFHSFASGQCWPS